MTTATTTRRRLRCRRRRRRRTTTKQQRRPTNQRRTHTKPDYVLPKGCDMLDANCEYWAVAVVWATINYRRLNFSFSHHKFFVSPPLFFSSSASCQIIKMGEAEKHSQMPRPEAPIKNAHTHTCWYIDHLKCASMTISNVKPTARMGLGEWVWEWEIGSPTRKPHPPFKIATSDVDWRKIVQKKIIKHRTENRKPKNREPRDHRP